MVSRQYLWQLKMLAKGVCFNCGKKKSVKGSRFCPGCRTKRRASSNVCRKKRYENRKAAGACVDCGGSPLETTTRCHDCAARMKEYSRVHYAKKRGTKCKTRSRSTPSPASRG